MSRKVLLVGVFLTVLPVVMAAVKAGADASPGNAVDTTVSAGGKAAKPGEAKPPHKPGGESTRPKPDSPPKLQGGERAILKALKRPASLEFSESPLKDVLDFLSEKYRIPIRMDSSALKEAGVDESTPITCKVSGISLQSALELMLDEVQLKWAIHYEVLLITSPAKAESDEFMYTKSYDVTDLLTPAKDCEPHPLDPRGNAFAASANTPAGGCNGVQSSSGSASSASDDVNSIKEGLASNVAPKTWEENGGTGTIHKYGRALVVSQTREIHAQIEQFLAELRRTRQKTPTLSIELHWLWLDAKQRDRLLGAPANSPHDQASLTVDRQRLRQLADEVPGFHAHIACENGLRTAVSAGDLRSVITSAVPVAGDAVAYQPVISVPNVGVTARVRPTVVPGTRTAMLEITSLLTRWDPSRPPAIIGAAWPAEKRGTAGNPPSTPAPGAARGSPAAAADSSPAGSASCPIDQPIMPAQQIRTTLRVPLGKPVVVGSISFAPAGDAGLGAAKQNAVEVYLVATTSVVKSPPNP